MVASSVFGGKNSNEKTGRLAFSISVIFVNDGPPVLAIVSWMLPDLRSRYSDNNILVQQLFY